MKMNMGFVKLHRELSNWEWSDSPNHIAVFVHLLLRVNYQPKTWRGVDVEAGSIITGRKKIAEWSGVKESTVFRVLKDLEACGEVNIKKTNKFSVITMVKWQQFQLDEQQTNNKRTSSEQQMNTTKERKERKKEKNIVEPLFSDVVNHLNSSTGKKYKATSKTLQRLIKARQGEGFKLEDFIQVIDTKTAEWKNTDMDQYLRPETLFGNKFEGYLNQGNPKNEINNKLIEALGGE